MDFTKLVELSLNEYMQVVSDIQESNQIVTQNVGSWMGRGVIWFKGLSDGISDWVVKHLESDDQLEDNTIVAAKIEVVLPSEVILPSKVEALNESDQEIREVANEVDHLIPEKLLTVDKHRLLTGDQSKEINPSLMEWHLNLGLLMNVYNSTDDEGMKKKIQFLALNYLAKAAPIAIKDLGLEVYEDEKFEEMFQLGVFEEAFYHRQVDVFGTYIGEEIQDLFPKSASLSGQVFLTDTIDFQELIPVFFHLLNPSKKDDKSIISTEKEQMNEWSNGILDALSKHFKSNKEDPFNQWIDPPILIDLTDLIGETIQIPGKKGREIFNSRMRQIEAGLEQAINQTIEKIKKYKPEFCQTPEDEVKLRVFLKCNISCISRTEVKGIGVLKGIHPFMDIKHYALSEGTNSFLKQKIVSSEGFSQNILKSKLKRTDMDLEKLVNYSGIRLGGVSGREKILNFMDLKSFIGHLRATRQITEYTVSGKNPIAFREKGDILKTKLFERFRNMNTTQDPQVTILGKATVDMVDGLMEEITEEKWKELNDNPDTRMILHQSLYRLMIHFATANNNSKNFTKFAQAMELAQSEIATLLAIASPFKEGDFERIYKDRLDIIPRALKEHVKVGVAKSAVNTFAGVNAAVQQMSPSLVRAHGEGVYYEIASLIGKNKTTQEILKSSDAVDLYVGEFHHNINVRKDHDHYKLGAVKDEIRLILNKNSEIEKETKEIKYLTVAIDVTIDFVNSPNAKELLEEFSKEIKEGKINFVFFRSGQKFEMFGIDNYYGGPFWMVNNGGEQWKNFDKLTISNTYKTDPLSMQWFCLANKYASKALDEYRGQIFKNARTILNNVPLELKKGGKHANKIRISTVDDKMEPSFIDIKVLYSFPGGVVNRLKERLFKRFKEAGIKLHERASFGFYHANWNVIKAEDGEERNIRINPGLNPEENKIILEFIQKDIPEIIST